MRVGNAELLVAAVGTGWTLLAATTSHMVGLLVALKSFNLACPELVPSPAVDQLVITPPPAGTANPGAAPVALSSSQRGLGLVLRCTVFVVLVWPIVVDAEAAVEPANAN